MHRPATTRGRRVLVGDRALAEMEGAARRQAAVEVHLPARWHGRDAADPDIATQVDAVPVRARRQKIGGQQIGCPPLADATQIDPHARRKLHGRQQRAELDPVTAGGSIGRTVSHPGPGRALGGAFGDRVEATVVARSSSASSTVGSNRPPVERQNAMA